MSYLKEPGFFSTGGARSTRVRPFDISGRIEWRRYRNDLASYLALFTDAVDVVYAGESSTAYSTLPARPGVAERIHEFNCKARILYLMRDPVERTISHYWWRVQHEGEARGLRAAICEDRYYRDVSFYAMQLRPYLRQFGAENVFWLTTEALASDPRSAIMRLFSWLGVDESIAPDVVRSRQNETPEVVVRPLSRIVDRARFSRLWCRLGPLCPKPIKRIGRRLTEHRFDRRCVDTGSVIEFLRGIQRKQTDELRRLLGYDFSEWRTLNEGCEDP